MNQSLKHLPKLIVLVLAGALSACLPPQPDGVAVRQSAPPIEIFFSPKGGCTEAVVKELNAAKTSVLVQAYSFTSMPIAKALVEAHKRGVKVEVLLDKSQRTEKYSDADFLANEGIPTRIDAQHAIAHNKIMIIDGETVITGSFNFTKAAEEHNAENLLVIRAPDLAVAYAANWKSHAAHCEAYTERQQGYSQTHRIIEPAEPADSSPPTFTSISDEYVTSKNSGVFHKAHCKSAEKIAAKNVVRYSSREEAIQAGKKPCAECNP